jgi:outer membrane protein assembly factor BamB
MLKIHQAWIGATAFGAAVLVATVHAQVGRGGSEWLTSRADAQRTSWIRTDPKISVETMSKPGFELQWTQKLDNKVRGGNNLLAGVTANGVTLFVPMSLVGGSSNNLYAIDNDTGYVVWTRRFDATPPASAPGCPGGMTAAATRIVPLAPPPIAAPAAGGGRAGQAYRSVIGEPGAGVPLEARGGRNNAPPPAAAPGAAGAPAGARGTAPAGAPAGAPGTAAAANAPQRQGGGGGGNRGAGPTIPGMPPTPAGGGLNRPSGVVYASSSDGVLHVMGLQSGKDLQKPAEFMPANARWSDAIAVNTTLYTTTSGKCANAPNGVWAIDLESDAKPVVSWKSNEDLVGPLAFTTDGTALVAKTNGIVALDSKTLQEKGSFTDPSMTFVTGPTVFRHNDKEIVAAGTKDGRIILLDAASLATPLFASTPIVTTGSIAADGLATWQEMTITAPPPPEPGAAAPPAGGGAQAAAANVTLGTRWIVAPVTGGIVALKLHDTGGSLSLEQGWTARNFSVPATPIVVNGVVFGLSTGRPAAGGGIGTPAVLRAYEGTSGKLLYDSKTAMKSFASPGSFWSALGQLYVGTNDGTLYAFGFDDERR